jgi:uncharacterized protein YjeT (DUF2065 family)
MSEVAMTTASDTTLLLAMLIGLYLCAAGIGGLLTPERWRRLLDEFPRSPGLGLISGVVAFIVGGAIVAVHNHWTDPLAVIVSLAGWIGLAEGFALLAFGDWWVYFTTPLASHPRVWGFAALVLGALLFFAGLTGHTVHSI